MRVIHKFFSVLGFKIEVKIEDKEFQDTLRKLHNLIDDEKWVQAKEVYDRLHRLYPDYPEVIRAGWFYNENGLVN